MADFKPMFEQPACPTPSGSAAGGTDLSGGYDLTDGRKETPNMSGLPPLPTIMNPGEGDPGQSQVAEPPVASPGTLPSSGAGN